MFPLEKYFFFFYLHLCILYHIWCFPQKSTLFFLPSLVHPYHIWCFPQKSTSFNLHLHILTITNVSLRKVLSFNLHLSILTITNVSLRKVLWRGKELGFCNLECQMKISSPTFDFFSQWWGPLSPFANYIAEVIPLFKRVGGSQGKRRESSQHSYVLCP